MINRIMLTIALCLGFFLFAISMTKFIESLIFQIDMGVYKILGIIGFIVLVGGLIVLFINISDIHNIETKLCENRNMILYKPELLLSDFYICLDLEGSQHAFKMKEERK